jgi:hypothetical protein
MEVFGGRRAVSGELARNGRLVVAAMLLGFTLTACGGGGDDGPAASAPPRSAEPPSAAVPPTGSLPDAGSTQGNNGGTPSNGGVAGGPPTRPDDVFDPGVEEQGTGSITLSWTPPTMNEDGSPLKLTGYRIYWGRSEGNYAHSVVLDNPGLTRYVIEKLASGTWYFVATALSGDLESDFSNVFSKTIE